MSNVGNLYNGQMECEVLAACISRPDIFDSVRERLTRDLFTDLDAIKCYDIIQDSCNNDRQPEYTEIMMKLMSQGVDVSRFTGTLSQELTRQRVNVLEDMSLRRRFRDLCHNGEMLSGDPTTDIAELNVLIDRLHAIMSGGGDDDVSTSDSVGKKMVNDVAERMERQEEMGLATGLHLFDCRYGFHGGDLVIIAGETSQGKSTLATTIARNMAVRSIPVAYYSMEMSSEQLLARINARLSKVPSSKVLYGKLTAEEFKMFYDGMNETRKLPIYFDERSKTSFQKMCQSIRRLVKTYKVRCVFIDYLQILVNGTNDNREQLTGDIARDLKRLAVELDICIVALSQLTRANERNGSKEPTISRMRGSGQIEEAADVCILIYRPSLYGDKKFKNGTPSEGAAQLYIAKGRNIGLGNEIVKFDGALSYFADFEQGDPQAPYMEHKEQLPF